MVHYTDVTKFLAQAHDMQKSTSCRLLIKYSLGNLKLKLTDDVNVSGTLLLLLASSTITPPPFLPTPSCPAHSHPSIRLFFTSYPWCLLLDHNVQLQAA